MMYLIFVNHAFSASVSEKNRQIHFLVFPQITDPFKYKLMFSRENLSRGVTPFAKTRFYVIISSLR